MTGDKHVLHSSAKLGMVIIGNSAMGHFEKSGGGANRMWDRIIKDNRAKEVGFEWPVYHCLP